MVRDESGLFLILAAIIIILLLLWHIYIYPAPCATWCQSYDYKYQVYINIPNTKKFDTYGLLDGELSITDEIGSTKTTSKIIYITKKPLYENYPISISNGSDMIFLSNNTETGMLVIDQSNFQIPLICSKYEQPSLLKAFFKYVGNFLNKKEK